MERFNREEASPHDMAIWRAILAGKVSYWRAPGGVRVMRRHLLMSRRRLPFTEAELDAELQRNPNLRWRLTCPLYRFVMFTHPYTGGRAVYSERVD